MNDLELFFVIELFLVIYFWESLFFRGGVFSVLDDCMGEEIRPGNSMMKNGSGIKNLSRDGGVGVCEKKSFPINTNPGLIQIIKSSGEVDIRKK